MKRGAKNRTAENQYTYLLRTPVITDRILVNA